MELAFYLSSLVAVLATLGVVTGNNPVRALVYLILSLIAVAMVLFALGAPFAGALEIIVYAGAIMVLFVFVVMMLNLGPDEDGHARGWRQPRHWIGPSILALALLGVVVHLLLAVDMAKAIDGDLLTARAVGLTLFGPWLIIVELSALLLLAGLVAASHVGRRSSPLRNGRSQ